MTAHPIHRAFDRATVGPKRAFRRARKVESFYSSALRRVARHVGDIVGAFGVEPDGGYSSETTARIAEALNRYAEVLRSWAGATAERMVTEVAARDEAAWMAVSRQMGRSLRKEIAATPVGEVVRARMAAQVDLITSLPREAAERVHKLTLEGIVQGTRPKEIAAEILRTGEVTKSRAMLIARTEVGRTSTELTKARAEKIGSTHFVWRTVGDSDVRPTHRKLEGKIFRWDDPPECDPGHHALPGAIWNCRCYPEPLIPDE
jgi:SPP1 gp7 family putative phage head morphogenesis protein